MDIVWSIKFLCLDCISSIFYAALIYRNNSYNNYLKCSKYIGFPISINSNKNRPNRQGGLRWEIMQKDWGVIWFEQIYSSLQVVSDISCSKVETLWQMQPLLRWLRPSLQVAQQLHRQSQLHMVHQLSHKLSYQSISLRIFRISFGFYFLQSNYLFAFLNRMLWTTYYTSNFYWYFVFNSFYNYNFGNIEFTLIPYLD